MQSFLKRLGIGLLCGMCALALCLIVLSITIGKGALYVSFPAIGPFLWNGQCKSNLFVHRTALSLLRRGGGDMPNCFSVGASLSFRTVCLRVSSNRRSAYAHSLFLRQIYPVCAFYRFNRLCSALHGDMGASHLAVEMPGRRDQSAAAGGVKATPYALGNHFGDVFSPRFCYGAPPFFSDAAALLLLML